MNTRQLTILLIPSIVFAGFSILLICGYIECKQVSEATSQNHPAFVKFIADVRDGRRPMTTELWIDHISATEDEAESF
jgi:hypothetical protein